MSDLIKAMADRTDEQLLAIITREHMHYVPEALAAAHDELKRRDITVDRIEQIRTEIEKEHHRSEQKASKPLFGLWKVFAFLCPGVVLLLAAAILKVEGFERQYRELKRWTLYGIAFYFSILLLVRFLS